MRLGNMVQHVDGIGSDPADSFVAAMGPPASDADKWYISVLSMQGCAACQKLKADWATNQWLLALADPNDPKKSWAHYSLSTSGGVLAEEQRKVEAKGTCKGLAARGRGSDSRAERTARAAEQIVVNTKDLLAQAKQGKLVFAP